MGGRFLSAYCVGSGLIPSLPPHTVCNPEKSPQFFSDLSSSLPALGPHLATSVRPHLMRPNREREGKVLGEGLELQQISKQSVSTF